MKKRNLYIVILTLIFIGLVAVTLKYIRKADRVTPVATIEITADGFVPDVLRISAGTRVTWINKDAAPHRVASNPHPEHTDLPELSSEDIGPGQSYTFTTPKTGTFGYHDEQNSLFNGTLQIETANK